MISKGLVNLRFDALQVRVGCKANNVSIRSERQHMVDVMKNGIGARHKEEGKREAEK